VNRQTSGSGLEAIRTILPFPRLASVMQEPINGVAGPKDAAVFASPGHVPKPELPFWDAEDHSLYWQGELVHRFRNVAPHQEPLLHLFQAHGWPSSLPVSLLADTPLGSKKRLRQTVDNLNANLWPWLCLRREGRGQRLRWEAV
jgi:hypothetical protein